MTDLDVSPTPESTRFAARPARPILLADGRQWGLALPTPRYRPEVVTGTDELGRPTATIRLASRTGYPSAIERRVDDLRAACRVGPSPAAEAARFDALMALAVALLQRAHDLTLPAAVELLDLDDAGLAHLVDAVLATVGGFAARLPGSDLSPPGGSDARPS